MTFDIREVDYIMFIDGSYKNFNMGIGILLCDNTGGLIRCRADFGWTSSAFAAETDGAIFGFILGEGDVSI